MPANENPVSGNQTPLPTTSPTTAASPALTEREQKEHAFREHIKAALEHNRKTLFDKLAVHAIASVTVCFDGYGDSGQIESIDAKHGDDAIGLPDIHLELLGADWNSSGIARRTCTIHEAVEEICYALLTQTHCGWENNEGAYGDFTFDVAGRSITLNYNERYTDSENHTHEF